MERSRGGGISFDNMKHKYPRFFVKRANYQDDTAFLRINNKGGFATTITKKNLIFINRYLNEKDCEIRVVNNELKEVLASELALML